MKKIMLCCNAGMSTSLLVQKMQSEVASRGLDIEVEARPMNEAHDHLDECDILLLGPQIGYTKGDFEKEAAGRFPVEVINMVDYGRMNAAGIIEGYFSNGTSTYKPNNTLTRGQVSAIVWRMKNSVQ